MNSLFRRKRRDHDERPAPAPSSGIAAGPQSRPGRGAQSRAKSAPARTTGIIENASLAIVTTRRLWKADGTRIADDSTQLSAESVTVAYAWGSDVERSRYWLTGDAPLPPMLVSWPGASVDLDLASWPLSGQGAIELPGASFSMRLIAIGGLRDPQAAIHHNIVIADGITQKGSSDLTPEVEITGDVMLLARWLSGTVGFRDVAQHLRVSGDFFLLGAIAGVYGIVGGAGVDPKCCAALNVAFNLSRGHRGIAPHGEFL